MLSIIFECVSPPRSFSFIWHNIKTISLKIIQHFSSYYKIKYKMLLNVFIVSILFYLYLIRIHLFQVLTCFNMLTRFWIWTPQIYFAARWKFPSLRSGATAPWDGFIWRHVHSNMPHMQTTQEHMSTFYDKQLTNSYFDHLWASLIWLAEHVASH